MIKNGVYIGKDIELVVTDKYVISYRRNTQMDMLESRLFKRSGNDFSCIGICVSIILDNISLPFLTIATDVSSQLDSIPHCYYIFFHIYSYFFITLKQVL